MKSKKFLAVALSLVLGVFLLSACTSETGAAPAAAIYTPGTYTGTGSGKGGEVSVDVEFTENEIVTVTIDEDNDETPSVAVVAYEELPPAIIEAQGTEDVDTVSGATFTSKGILEAVDNAIDQAKA